VSKQINKVEGLLLKAKAAEHFKYKLNSVLSADNPLPTTHMGLKHNLRAPDQNISEKRLNHIVSIICKINVVRNS